jgi:hypothetical protein
MMAGLTDKAGGASFGGGRTVEQAQRAWQESMLRQLERLRESVKTGSPEILADRCGGAFEEGGIRFAYWGWLVSVGWPDLEARYLPDDEPCSTFDTAMFLYYLDTADGTPMADQWIGYRELPDGAFYSQAFQGYSGDKIAEAFGDDPEAFRTAARDLDGWWLSGLGDYAFAFQPLPRIRLGAILWPGDEEFPARASVLFDAAASHYMTTDGLALLGAGLSGRLVKAKPEKSQD